MVQGQVCGFDRATFWHIFNKPVFSKMDIFFSQREPSTMSQGTALFSCGIMGKWRNRFWTLFLVLSVLAFFGHCPTSQPLSLSSASWSCAPQLDRWLERDRWVLFLRLWKAWNNTWTPGPAPLCHLIAVSLNTAMSQMFDRLLLRWKLGLSFCLKESSPHKPL